MEEEPTNLRRQVVLYSIPLFLVTSHFSGAGLFFLSIPSSIIAFMISGAKRRMYISNVLFLLFLFFPETYFICYGFTVTAVYTSINDLCLGSFQESNLKTCMAMESAGLFLSLYLLNSRIVSLVIVILQFVNIHVLISPPVESANCGEVYEGVTELLGDTSFVNRMDEYRSVVSGVKKRTLGRKIDFLTPLLMGKLSLFSKTTICCSSLFFGKKSYWLSFVAYSLLLLSFESACTIISFFCDFTPGHPVYRLLSVQVLYVALRCTGFDDEG